MFCEKCGTEIKQNWSFCMNCGASVNSSVVSVNESNEQTENLVFEKVETETITEEKNAGAERISETAIIEDSVLEIPLNQEYKNAGYCKSCGARVEDGENYCASCGSLITGDTECIVQENDEIGLQKELEKLFTSNKILSFISKYSWIFLLVYPLYILLARFDFSSGFYESINEFSIPLFYAYNIGLLATYANKKHIFIVVALGLRILNSVLLLCQGATVLPSVLRILIIVVTAGFVYNLLLTVSERQLLLKKIKFWDENSAK